MSEEIRVNRCCPVGCIGDKQIHDNLVAEVERLQKENETHKKVIYNQLKEALRKCSPFNIMSHPEAKCNFCGNDDESHKPNCEYIKLIGGYEQKECILVQGKVCDNCIDIGGNYPYCKLGGDGE